MTVVPMLRSWISHEPPVLTGVQERPVWTFEDLGDPTTSGWLVSALESLTENPDEVGLTPVRWAVWTALELLVAPLAHDGIEIDVTPDQIGVVLGDALVVNGHWLGDVAADGESVSAARVGLRLRRLVDPVMDATCERGAIGVRRGEQILRSTITAGVRRVEVACAEPAVGDWADDVLRGAVARSPRSRTGRRSRALPSPERRPQCATA